MAREYSEKAAVVTGGARGIGQATAALLAARGYRVAIADRAAPARGGSGVAFIRCDVSRENDVRRCMREVLTTPASPRPASICAARMARW